MSCEIELVNGRVRHLLPSLDRTGKTWLPRIVIINNGWFEGKYRYQTMSEVSAFFQDVLLGNHTNLGINHILTYE